MNITRLKRILLLLLPVLLIYGCCREKDEPEEERISYTILPYFLYAAPYVPVDSFPEWIQNRIDTETAFHPSSIVIRIQVFQGEWRGQTVYYIYKNLDSCLFCPVYYEDGERVDFMWNPWLQDEFTRKSRNWKIIFDYGEGGGYPFAPPDNFFE
ncbi:MAG: hypothetical protein LBP64_05705 [Tannerella sp.]|jgi:hypothetical protein|nr:hypothetical protein [Tannerella sp.]